MASPMLAHAANIIAEFLVHSAAQCGATIPGSDYWGTLESCRNKNTSNMLVMCRLQPGPQNSQPQTSRFNVASIEFYRPDQ